MTSESSNTREMQLEQSYFSLMNKMREILLVIINLTVGILAVNIYPLDRFKDQEILISLTLFISALVTFYYLLNIPSVDFRITMILTILLLVNTTIASIVIDVAFYHFTIILIFYSSIFILRKGLLGTISSYFIESMIIFSYISGIIFWYYKPETSSDIFLIEIIMLQALLAYTIFTRISASKIYQLSFLPFVFNIALLPIIMQIQTDIRIVQSDEIWLVEHIIDIQLLIYGVLFLLYLLPNINSKDQNSYSQYFIGHSVLLPSIFIISKLYDVKFSQYIISSTEIIINPFSLILTIFTVGLFFTLNESKMKLKNVSYLPYFSLGVTAWFVLMNLSSTDPIKFVDHGILVILILLPFVFLFKSSEDAIISVFQSVLLLSLSFFEYNEFVQYIQNGGLLIFIGLTLFLAKKYQNDRDAYHVLIFSGIALISFNALLFEYTEFISIDFIYLLLSVLAVTATIFVTSSKYSNLISNGGSMAAWYFLSFYSRRRIFFTIQEIGFDILDIALLVLIGFSIISTIIKPNSTNIINSVYLTQGLGIVYMLSGSIATIPNYIILALMVMLPSIQILLRSDLLLKSEIVLAQSVSIFIYQFISQKPFEFGSFELNLMTVLYGMHISVPFFLSIKKKVQNIYVSIASSNLFLIAFYGFFTIVEPSNIASTLEVTIPHYIVIGLISTVLTFSIFQTKDTQYPTTLVVIQAITVWILHILNNYIIIDLVDLNFSGIQFAVDEVITASSLTLLSFVIMIMYFDSKNEGLRELNTGIIFGLILSILVFNQTDLFYRAEPIILVGIILCIKLISNIISKIEINPWSYFTFVLIFIIMKLHDDQTLFAIFGNSISITALFYLLIVVLITISTMNQKDNTVIYLVISFSTLLLAITESNSNGAVIQLEFLITALFTTFLLFRNTSSNDSENNSAAMYLVSLVFFLLISANNDLPRLIDLTFKDQIVEYVFITNLSYVLYTFLLSGILLKSSKKQAWNYLYINFIILESILALSNEKLIHPIILAISILIFSLPLIFQYEEHIRTNLPFLQGISLLTLSFQEYTIESFNLDISLNFSFYVIWANVILLMWYKKGINNQLISTISAIFAVAGGYAALFYFEIIKYFEPVSVFIILIESTLIIFIYNARSAAQHTSDIYRILFSAIGSIFLLSLVIRDNYSDNELLIYRMILDWLLFIPIFIQTVIYARPLVEQIYSNPRRYNEGDTTVLSIMLLFIVTSLFIGSEEIFAVKLVVLAIVFWVFAGTTIRPILSWSASIFSIFVFGWIVAQLGQGEPGEGDPRYSLYFLSIAGFGILMLISGLINEVKYKGEPFTSSLMISGSVLTSVSVIIPLFPEFKSPFPYVNEELGYDIMNFIPNVVWAILGLFLFVVSIKISKDYLRKIGLSVLILDIVKTGYDIFSLSENQLIRIIGSMVLGAVLILIFYLFTLEEEQEQAISE